MATGFEKHIDHFDTNNTGILDQIAVIKRWDDGSLSYVQIDNLDDIDKDRLRKILSSPHADKYELWELLSQSTLTNGLNALDYFHKNYVKIHYSPNAIKARYTNQGLKGVKFKDAKVIPGSETSDPTSGVAVDKGAQPTF